MSKKILTVFIAEYIVKGDKKFTYGAIIPEKLKKGEIERVVKIHSLIEDLKNGNPKAQDAIEFTFAKNTDELFSGEVKINELEYFSDEAEAVGFIKGKQAEIEFRMEKEAENELENEIPESLDELMEEIQNDEELSDEGKEFLTGLNNFFKGLAEKAKR